VTIRNLDALFRPSSIALIGASNQRGSIGAILAANLLTGPLKGHVWPVNPRHRRIRGTKVYRDLDRLPQAPDLGVICTPAAAVPGVVSDLGRRGARAAVIITAGFAEDREARGSALQREVLEAARAHGLRVLGPNCVGILVPGIGLNASFAHRPAHPGNLAFVAQSGAIITSVLDWADARGIGFSALVSLGDMADVDFGDLLDYLAADPGTRAILLYIESVGDARKFLSAARAAARIKPLVAVKAGRHPEGARAVTSHTGALAGSDAVCQAAFDRAGILRVFTLAELFDAVEILALARPPKGDRLAILTNGGGVGVLATDALIDEGGRLAALSEETLAALDQALPRTWSHGNPVDLIGDATGQRYREALATIQKDPGVDGILALHAPTAVVSALEAAEAVASAAPGGPLLLTSWVGDGTMAEPRRRFAKRGIPTYGTPEQAVRAFMYLVRYRRGQRLLAETPPSLPEGPAPDTASVAALIAGALGEGRSTLTEPEAKAVLAAYGIPVVTTRPAANPEEAAAIAGEMVGPLVLKILSPDIGHKSDVGGVVLDLMGPGAVLETARAMRARIAESHPQARIQGFAVQPMVRRPGAQELIVGAAEDTQFGPVILVGHGGIAVEALADRALGLPPLNLRLARELLARTRIHRLLQGIRGRPPADLDAVALTLVQVSQLVIDHPEIRELDINPLLVDESGVMALDARVALARPTRPGSGRLAIRPYPRELEEWVPVGDGRRLLLRPIRPEDEPALRRAFAKLTLEEVRLRFFVPMPTLSHEAAARLTQIDYDREMALILTEPGVAEQDEIYGVVRLIADPDNARAEFAIIVRQAMAGRGLGTLLMRRILDYARARGIGEVFGVVLPDNTAMLRLCDKLGFERRPNPGEPGTVLVTLSLAVNVAIAGRSAPRAPSHA
jgi:acetyltransferase